MPEQYSGGELAVFAPPTPGAQELFRQVFSDGWALDLFAAATQIEGRIIPEYKAAFVDYVTESSGLSPQEADEIFFRLWVREQNGG